MNQISNNFYKAQDATRVRERTFFFVNQKFNSKIKQHIFSSGGLGFGDLVPRK